MGAATNVIFAFETTLLLQVKTMGVCANCSSNRADNKCSRCKTLFYCGRDCQLTHWKSTHKHTCGKTPLVLEDYPNNEAYAQAEAHLLTMSEVLMQGYFAKQIPGNIEGQTHGNHAKLATHLETIVRNRPRLNKQDNFLQDIMRDNEALFDIEIFVERLPGFQALVDIHRRDSRRVPFFPPPESPLCVTENLLHQKCLQCVRSVSQDLADDVEKFGLPPITNEAEQRAAGELVEYQRSMMLANPRFNSYTGICFMAQTPEHLKRFKEITLPHFGLGALLQTKTES